MASSVHSFGKRVRVCIVEAHAIAKKHLQLILSSELALRITEIEPQNLRSLLRPAPHVFVLSHFHPSSLPNYLRLVRRSRKNAKILLIGPGFRYSTMFSLFRSGVHGFVSDKEVDADLATAIRGLVEGRVWIRTKYLAPDRNDKPQKGATLQLSQRFTPSQARVVELVRESLSNKQIAAELGISERTVKFHLQNIFASLGVTTRYEIPKAFPPTTLYGRTVCPQRATAPAS